MDSIELDDDCPVCEPMDVEDAAGPENKQDAEDGTPGGDKGRSKGGKGKGKGSHQGTDKALSGVKKPSKKYSRQCRGCGLFFSPEGMAQNQVFCHKDKLTMDCISRVARNQGKKQWFNEVRASDTLARKAIKSYRAMTSPVGDAKKKVMQKTVVQELERETASSRVIYDAEYEMMHEDEYIKFATETEKGHKLSKAQAQAN